VETSITINGAKISSLETFYAEIEKKLTKNLEWKMGKNLNVFNDVLRSSFGYTNMKSQFDWFGKKVATVDKSLDGTRQLKMLVIN